MEPQAQAVAVAAIDGMNDDEGAAATADAVAKAPFQCSTQSNKLQIRMEWSCNKVKTTSRRNPSATTKSFFDPLDAATGARCDDETQPLQPARQSPLVIPVAQNRRKYLATKQEQQQKRQQQHPDPDLVVSAATTTAFANEQNEQAARALHEESIMASTGISLQFDDSKSKVILAHADTFQRDKIETVAFQKDLDQLAMDVDDDSDVYQRVPIADFGAAMLRGMGWKEESISASSSNVNKRGQDDNNSTLPRPHRLGLGAIPAALPALLTGGKNRRPGDFQRQQAMQQQQEEFARQRQQQITADKQQTLQDGSLVRLRNHNNTSQGNVQRRAKILKLRGVPGLSRIRVQLEGDPTAAIISKGDVQGLISRQELEDRPFQHVELDRYNPPLESNKQAGRLPLTDSDRRLRGRDYDGYKLASSKVDSATSSIKGTNDHGDAGDLIAESQRPRDDRKSGKRSRDERSKRDDNRDWYDRHPLKNNRASSKTREKYGDPQSLADDRKGKDEVHFNWLIPNIRVRIVTEKLGRNYFKQKAMVVDVTTGGATLQLSDGGSMNRSKGTVLDRVAEQ